MATLSERLINDNKEIERIDQEGRQAHGPGVVWSTSTWKHKYVPLSELQKFAHLPLEISSIDDKYQHLSNLVELVEQCHAENLISVYAVEPWWPLPWGKSLKATVYERTSISPSIKAVS